MKSKGIISLDRFFRETAAKVARGEQFTWTLKALVSKYKTLVAKGDWKGQNAFLREVGQLGTIEGNKSHTAQWLLGLDENGFLRSEM